MPLFGHHHKNEPDGFSGNIPAGFTGLPEFGQAEGWEPVPGQPFDGHLETAVHEITRAMYGAARTGHAVMQTGIRVGGTAFPDAFRASVGGRTVIVANAWTSIEAEVRYSTGDVRGVAVCAVEVPAVLPFLGIQSRRFPPIGLMRVTPTGDPGFDERFAVNAVPEAVPGVPSLDAVLTPEVRQRIMAHDDWVFWHERYLLGCVSPGVFRSAAEVSQRIGEVLGMVAAFPASAAPRQVDHSADDLMARIAALKSMDEGMAFLTRLTPADREQLARSGSPLAVLADVRTPQEAMARFRSLPQPQKMQLMMMFMEVKDQQRRR